MTLYEDIQLNILDTLKNNNFPYDKSILVMFFKFMKEDDRFKYFESLHIDAGDKTI